MKLTAFIRPLISLICLVFAAMPYTADACGPYAPCIPTPDFFGITKAWKSQADYDRDENLRLWQSLTSERIPLADIERAVYKDSCHDFLQCTGDDPDRTENLFYHYLNNSHDEEIFNFILLAKGIEETWNTTRSAWYYPRSSSEEISDFAGYIKRCKAYRGERLKDRYGLQGVRALFASRRYAECASYADSVFADIPDNNLMKRMARRYAAGCWSRLGDTRRADSVFALAGDIWSLSVADRTGYMAERNPDAPQLMEYIRRHASDSAYMCGLLPLANQLVSRRKVKNDGDWNFLIAYVNNEYTERPDLARKHISRAMKGRFSGDELHDLARAYRMKLDAGAGYRGNLISDLKWIDSKADVLGIDANEWVRRCCNVIYVDWIPRLWKAKDYATAIMLCSYADNLAPDGCKSSVLHWPSPSSYYFTSETPESLRNSEELYNPYDYGSLSFQMMGSLSSSQLIAVYERMKQSDQLYNFLRKNIRTDSDFYYELIGTLALREENYARAENYLSRVSDKYIRTMNIYKDGYLSREAFIPYSQRWELDGEWVYDGPGTYHEKRTIARAKLDFARTMKSYRYKMRNAPTADERGIARLMYAIGRRNSFEECWALTQYWRGWVGLFSPVLTYWDCDFAEQNYDFLYDYDDYQATEKLYHNEVAAALAMLTTDESRAKAQYILGNLKTVVKRYGDTATAQFVRTSCDNWRSWL